jgi:hypothetical protein
MAKYLELDTDVPVDVRVLPPFKGGEPVAEVVYPNGRRYGLQARDIDAHFRMVTPQVVEIGAAFGAEYDR